MSVDNSIMNTARSEYTKAMPNWILSRDVVNLDVKTDLTKSLVYLPYPSTTPPPYGSNEWNNRYIPYRLRAILYGYAKRTVDTLTGSAFKKPPVLDNLPKGMDELVKDITGTGLSVDQFAKADTRTTMITGRSGMYTSFPTMPENATAAQTNGVMPFVSIYNAEDIPFWADDNSLIVLSETYDKSENEFEIDLGVQLRALRLRDSGATSQVYRDDGTESEEIPLKGGSGQLKQIPFEWVGSANNDNIIDESLILPIAEINLGHYRNSADDEENTHIHGQTTTYFTSDMQDHQIEMFLKDGIEMGARSAHFLGASGSMGTVSANANDKVTAAMIQKEQAMIQLGAKIIRDSANETAEAVRIQSASETANLSSLIHNVSKATENSLKHCAEFLGIDGSAIEYNISQEFFDENIDPAMIIALTGLYDRGVIGDEEITEPLRKAGWIKRTWRAIKNEVELRVLG